MFLESLLRYYDAAASRGIIAPYGYARARIKYALDIDPSGVPRRLVPLQQIQEGKKPVAVPVDMNIPRPATRSANIAACFLCDKSVYLLGLNDDDNAAHFHASKSLHNAILYGINSEIAMAILNFFNSWDPAMASQNVIRGSKEIGASDLIAIRVDGVFAHDDKEIQAAWEKYSECGEDACVGICSITGRSQERLERVHTPIRGIAGTLPTGARLIQSHGNQPDASSSYGQYGTITPAVGKPAAFSIHTALSHMVSQPHAHLNVGGDTIIYWSEDANPGCQYLLSLFLEPGKQQDELSALIENMENDQTALRGIDLDLPICIMALSPNISRLSVRFVVQNSLRNVLNNLARYYRDIAIEHAPHEWDYAGLYSAVRAISTPNMRNAVSTLIASSLVRAILSGAPIPASVYDTVLRRIFKDDVNADNYDKRVSYIRAGLIKAYFLSNPFSQETNPALLETLNPYCSCKPYVLGRLFSVLENIHRTVLGSDQDSGFDRYFVQACATPGLISPLLLRSSIHDERRMAKGLRVYYSKLLEEIMDLFDPNDSPFPTCLSRADQGLFVLGYYLQNQNKFKSKISKPRSDVIGGIQSE